MTPAPEHKKLVAVCAAAGDGALGRLVQRAACTARPGDSVHPEDTMAPTVAVDAVNDKSPAFYTPKVGLRARARDGRR